MYPFREWKDCSGCGTIGDVANIFGDAALLAQIYDVNLPQWRRQPNTISQLRAAVHDQDLVRLVHGSAWGVVWTPSRERLLDFAASRMDVMRNHYMNRDTTLIVAGVPGCGKKFFVKLLVAAITIFLKPVTYWASFRTRLSRLRFDMDSEGVLVFGFEDMSSLPRMNCEHSQSLWNYLKGYMKRAHTLGFLVESLQAWPDVFFQSRGAFGPLNNSVVGYSVYEPLLTTAEYSDFFRVLGIERPPFATLELLQFWTGGRLSRLFDLFGRGPVPPETLAETLPRFPSKYACLAPFKFEERVAWVHLAILNSPQDTLPSSAAGAIFELPVFKVAEIEDELADDEQKTGDWMKFTLDYVLTEQKDWHCTFRLASPHLLMQLHSPPRPPRATIVSEFQKLLPEVVIFSGCGKLSPKRLALLLAKCGGPTDSDDLSTYFERWLAEVSPSRQQAALLSIFETEGSSNDSNNSNGTTPSDSVQQSWRLLFRSNRPVVVEGFDLAAARELFQFVNGRPGRLEELHSVILTWESPVCELEDFFEGRETRKVLYVDGCLLPNGQAEEATWKDTGNWLLGTRRHSVAFQSSGWRMIRQHLLSHPVLMVGCRGAVRNSIMQTKIYEAGFGRSSAVLFRVVEERLPHVPFLRDLDYTTREGYFELLRSLFNLFVVTPADKKDDTRGMTKNERKMTAQSIQGMLPSDNVPPIGTVANPFSVFLI